jgi:phenylacetic acid degradation operon negative regulatory protein
MLQALLADLRDRPSRTGALIITLYGDALASRGGSVWLGTLLEVFRAMGVGDGVVRTAVSRLATEGWLSRSRAGRNSFYRLDQAGRRESEAAALRIYGPLAPAWDGAFRLALVEPAARGAFAGAGFGAVSPGVMLAAGGSDPPSPSSASSETALLLTARADLPTARRLAARAGPLGDLEALIARMLLIQEYRRIVLRDPHLPADLLPAAWPGAAARSLCAGLYAAMLPGSERWLDEHGVCETGPLPVADPALRRCFVEN